MNKEQQALWARKNPEKVKEYQNKRKLKNPDTFRKKDLNKYGITLEEYDAFLKLQNHVCAICKQPEVGKHQSGRVKRLSVDHDHKSGKVRGLLCGTCNRGIGYLKDSVDILKNATKYLEERK